MNTLHEIIKTETHTSEGGFTRRDSFSWGRKAEGLFFAIFLKD